MIQKQGEQERTHTLRETYMHREKDTHGERDKIMERHTQRHAN